MYFNFNVDLTYINIIRYPWAGFFYQQESDMVERL